MRFSRNVGPRPATEADADGPQELPTIFQHQFYFGNRGSGYRGPPSGNGRGRWNGQTKFPRGNPKPQPSQRRPFNSAREDPMWNTATRSFRGNNGRNNTMTRPPMPRISNGRESAGRNVFAQFRDQHGNPICLICSSNQHLSFSCPHRAKRSENY